MRITEFCIFFVQISFENISYENLWQDTSTNPASYVFAFYGAFWAYGGYDTVGNIVEEIKQPLKRNVPLSVTSSIVVVIAIYVLSTVTTVRLQIPSLQKYPRHLFWPFFNLFSTFWGWKMSIFVSCECSFTTPVFSQSLHFFVQAKVIPLNDFRTWYWRFRQRFLYRRWNRWQIMKDMDICNLKQQSTCAGKLSRVHSCLRFVTAYLL